MMWWHRLFHPGKNEEALEKELRFHLDLHTNDLIAQGYSPEEARRQARLALGGPEQVKEMCRDERRTRWLADLLQDLRYGVRILAKHPGFTVVAVLALALGIGVNATILSTVNGFVLRPLPVENPEELVTPFWGRKTDAHVWGRFSYPNYVDLREQNKSFSDLCAWSETSAGISSSESRKGGDSERAEVIWGELVSGNYFDVMGVKPVLGRAILPEEDRTPNAHPVTVISHQLWQRRFNADQGIVGKTIYLNGQPFTVIGVMPESFLGGVFYLRKAFWVPLMMGQKFGRRAQWNTDRGYTLFNLYGRLKPGLTMAQAENDLNLVAEGLAKLYPKENADTKIQLTTEVNGRYDAATRIIMYGGLLALCVSGLVLLLACANVANLMLARAATRAREIGIRLAIGASRGRIVRQLLTESLLLAVLGGVLGLAFSYWGADLIRSSFPPVPYPVSFDYAPDGYVLKWMLVVSLLTGVIFGLAPALLASRTDLVAVIKGGGAGPSHSRRRLNLRGVLVIAQVTISLVVLICAGLFIRSLSQARQTDPGFKSENLVTMMINPSLLAYDEKETTKRFFPELLRRLEAQPGVRSAALVNEMPLMVENLTRGPIVKEGEIDPPPNQGVNSDCNFVTPKYFDTMQTPLVQGRDFTDRDTLDAPPVVVVNQEFARRFYGSEQNAMGKRFRLGQSTPLMEIIGIARDGHYRTLYEDRLPFMFLPVYQHPRTGMTLLISAQTSAALEAVVESARREIAQLDARMPVYGVMMAEENMSIAYWGPNMAAGMATTFGVLALVLATMGLYSVMTYDVSQRTHEIGIRMALGASLRDVLRLIVGQGMRMALIGIVLGLMGAFALTRVLSSLLLGVGTTDFVTFVGVPVLLIAVALLACYIPARRAARVDPLVALRHE
ncbi:MAG TPA: ABC transporter permease [Pyrinomonadaceae bacterium]|jgi:putative ABC transport system permease protein|nr:ABC transporter permease [Pyrinomonadaceae bacterium]